ncbi:TMEM175 family protein [Lacticaseibacillus chiayiensis]|uniref:TMEM175 family protein n=1 Tax=Lacticaseibacillus chiayiensis TaxID=2100821 RepID=UPI0010112B43|nr:TMEM175 family protein [Lacticaseibacillus chiayiensis]RXT58750.1 hypothetical protein CHT97_04385 [Lacticaseibacillus chiayiensis]
MISKDLKNRLDTFIDAIIAIIITIMVLELPAKSWQNHVHITDFFLAVGVYAVSFCFVANVWYQQATLFSTVKRIPRRIVIWEFILVFLLSLVPALTRLMSGDVEILSVEIYGALYLLVITVFRIISRTIVHQQARNKAEMQRIYTSIYGTHNLENVLMIAAIMVLAIFFPKAAYVLYIAIPIRSFFTIDSDARELTGIQQMGTTGRHDYLRMNREQQMKFRRLVGEFIRESRGAHGDTAATKAAWEKFSTAAQQELKIDPATLNQWFTAFQQVKKNGKAGTTAKRPTPDRSRQS